MTMLEKIARKIFESRPWRFSWEDAPPKWHEDFRAYARAAVEAMREPTDAMIDAAGVGYQRALGSFGYADAWRAMADAILTEPQHD